MKKLCATFLSLFLFSAIHAGECDVMSGTYSIGKQDADFSTFSEAAKALNCGGVRGPVTILVDDGIYEEQVILNQVRGTSAQNTILFTSKSAHAANVILKFGAGMQNSSWTIALVGADHVTFQNMTIEAIGKYGGNAVKMSAGAMSNGFKNVLFNGTSVHQRGAANAIIYSEPGVLNHGLRVKHCEFNHGSYGVYAKGNGKLNEEQGFEINGSIFSDQFEGGVLLSHQIQPLVVDNVIVSHSASENYTGVALDHCNGKLSVSNNIIKLRKGRYALHVNDCVGRKGVYGSYSNNSILLYAESGAIGLYIEGVTNYAVFNFNRIKFSGSYRQSENAFYKNEARGDNVNMINNIFYNLDHGGYTVVGNTFKNYIDSTPEMDDALYTAKNNSIVLVTVLDDGQFGLNSDTFGF